MIHHTGQNVNNIDEAKGDNDMNNKDIRAEIESSRLRYWRVAQAYGCTDATFSRKLRVEFPEAEKAKIREIIARLVRGGDIA